MAGDYNGTSSVSKTSGSPVTGTAFTMAGWIYSDTTSGLRYAFGLQNPSSNQGWRIGFNGTSIILQCIGSGTQNTQVSWSSASAQWMHLAMVCASATSRIIYKNGVSIGTGTSSQNPSGVNEIRIGAGTGGGGVAAAYWDGAIGHVALWNVGLTAAEMLSLSGGAFPLSVRPASIVAHYPLGGFYPYNVQNYGRGGYALDSVPSARGIEPRVYHIGRGGFTTAATSASTTITADQASFSLTGQASSLRPARLLASAQSSFTLSGQSASLTRNYRIAASQASFSESGQSASPTASMVISAAQSSLSIAGQDATVSRGHRLAASHGSLSATASDAALYATRTIPSDTSSVSLVAQDVGLISQHTTSVSTGEYLLTGSDAQLGSPTTLSAQHAAFSVAASDVSTTRGRVLPCESGSFDLSGQQAGTPAQRGIVASYASFSENGQGVLARRSLALSCDSTQVDATLQDSQLLRSAVAMCISAAFEVTATDSDLFLRILTIERPYVETWSRQSQDLGSELSHRRTSMLELQLESGHKLRRESRTIRLVQ